MKKANRKLIPAVAMLLISAIMLSTSSFAWFSLNSEVKATGMKVNAVADTSLLIAGKDDNTFKNFSDVGTTTAADVDMKPCTSADGKTFGKLSTGNKVLSESDAQATWKGGSFDKTDIETLNSQTNYVLEAKYKIKTVGDAKNFYVNKIDVTTNVLGANQSIRVAVTFGSKTLVFNPCNGTLLDEGVGKFTTEWTLSQENPYTEVNKLAALMGEATNDAKDVTIKVWFEGQDKKCNSAAFDTNDYSVDVFFTTDVPSN